MQLAADLSRITPGPVRHRRCGGPEITNLLSVSPTCGECTSNRRPHPQAGIGPDNGPAPRAPTACGSATSSAARIRSSVGCCGVGHRSALCGLNRLRQGSRNSATRRATPRSRRKWRAEGRGGPEGSTTVHPARRPRPSATSTEGPEGGGHDPRGNRSRRRRPADRTKRK